MFDLIQLIPEPVQAVSLVTLGANVVTMFLKDRVDNPVFNFGLRVLNVAAGNILKNKNKGD